MSMPTLADDMPSVAESELTILPPPFDRLSSATLLKPSALAGRTTKTFAEREVTCTSLTVTKDDSEPDAKPTTTESATDESGLL